MIKLSAGLATLFMVATFGGPAVAQEAMTRRAINPSTMSGTVQNGYSQAVVVEPGTRMIFVSGQVGWRAEGPNDFEAQVDRAFANLTSALRAAGSSPADVVKITLLIKDHHPARLAYLVQKRREVFGASPPASTLIPVTLLYADDVSFEIDAIAVTSQSPVVIAPVP